MSKLTRNKDTTSSHCHAKWNTSALQTCCIECRVHTRCSRASSADIAMGCCSCSLAPKSAYDAHSESFVDLYQDVLIDVRLSRVECAFIHKLGNAAVQQPGAERDRHIDVATVPV